MMEDNILQFYHASYLHTHLQTQCHTAVKAWNKE